MMLLCGTTVPLTNSLKRDNMVKGISLATVPMV